MLQVTTAAPEKLSIAAAPSPLLGVTLGEDACSFRVWAPHAQSAHIELRDGTALPLARDGDTWAGAFAPGLPFMDWRRTPAVHACMHACGAA
jgi:1,4-alpha-glucan branching enzyme